MRLKKLLVTGVLLSSTMFLLLAGCGKKAEEESADASSEPTTEEVVEETGPVSYLTGESIDEEYADSRPIAIMIPNDNYGAIPQCGIGEAGVIYEAPVEGAYTRLMCLLDAENYSTIEKLGPVRSCRLYYAEWALEWDAIYTHYGEAYYAQSFVDSGNIDNMNGLNSTIDSLVFSRDSSRKKPNNAFVTGESLLAGIDYCQYDTTHSTDYTGNYTFAEDEVTLDSGDSALVVKPGYTINKPWFEYNEEDGLYYRYQYDDKQIDGNTDEQLSVKNIIIQSCESSTLDEKGYLDIDTTAGGEGYYITNGKEIHITWTKADSDSAAKYFDDQGNEIQLNTGKTWVCIVQNSNFSKVQFLDSTEEN